jgi:hypothetical protein
LIVPYTALPGGLNSPPRPLLDVVVGDVESVRMKCLVDSGAIHTVVPAWAADLAGIDLSGGDVRYLSVGGSSVEARFVAVRMTAAGLTWDAPVGFCDAWPYAWGLLGHDSFFRWFTVTFRAMDLEFEIEPITT